MSIRSKKLVRQCFGCTNLHIDMTSFSSGTNLKILPTLQVISFLRTSMYWETILSLPNPAFLSGTVSLGRALACFRSLKMLAPLMAKLLIDFYQLALLPPFRPRYLPSPQVSASWHYFPPFCSSG